MTLNQAGRATGGAEARRSVGAGLADLLVRPLAALRVSASPVSPVVRIAVVLTCMATLAADDRGEPSVLRGIFGIGLLLFGPLIAATVLGFVQLGIYKLLVKSGAMQADSVPMFPILVMRGLMLLIALIAATLFWLKASGRALPFSG